MATSTHNSGSQARTPSQQTDIPVVSLVGASTEDIRTGHFYGRTYVSGGFNVQGDVHVSQAQGLDKDSLASAMSVLKSLKCFDDDLLTRLELRNKQLSSEKARTSLSRIIDISRSMDEIYSPSQMKRCIHDLGTLMANLLPSEDFVLEELSQTCRDSLSSQLAMTVGILGVSAEMQGDLVHSNSVPTLSHFLGQKESSSDRRFDLQYHGFGRRSSVGAEERPTEAALSTTQPLGRESTIALRNRKRSRKFQPSEHQLARRSNISGLPAATSERFKTQSSTTSWTTRLGKIDLLTMSRPEISSNEVESMGQSDKWMFASTIKIIPSTVENGSGRLLVVRVRQVRSTHIVMTLPPMMQLRNIRPFDSEIFVLAERGSVSELCQLLAAGEGSISDCSPSGFSLLACALLHINFPVVKFLLDNGADVDACESIEGYGRPLLLMEGGADPSGLDPSSSRQTTWVSYALMSASTDACRVMLDHGHPFFSPNAIYTSDEVPLLRLAACHRYGAYEAIQIPDKVALLLSRGAAADTHDSEGNTWLHLFMQYRTEEYPAGRIFQNKIDKECDGELLDILMLLITAGADVHARNDYGESPSDIAYRWGHEREWARALKECGYDSRSVVDAKEQSVCWSSGHDFQGAFFRQPLLTFAEYLSFRKLRHVEEVPYGWSECEEYESSRGEGSSRDEEASIGEIGEDVWEDWETSSDVDGDDDSHDFWEDTGLEPEHAHTEVPVIDNSDARLRDAQELQVEMLEAYRASKHKST